MFENTAFTFIVDGVFFPDTPNMRRDAKAVQVSCVDL
jgi:hypothetical protein